MSVLVIDFAAEAYAARLRDALPKAEVRTAPSFEAAEPHYADAKVVVTMGVPVHGLLLTPEIVERMPRLGFVQSLLAGTEFVERAVAGRPDVVVASTRGIHGPQMTETALLHMLTLARRGKQLVRNQDARTWEVLPPTVLWRKRVAIVGLGASGETMARVFAALGMRVVAVSRTERQVDGVERTLPRERLAEAVADADFVVLALPGGDETARIVDAGVLAAMKPSAFLVNVSRGSVVDEEALVAALRDGGIAGAGLDVFATEPLPAESLLWELDDVVVTPHLGGRSDLYVEQALAVVEPNVRAFLEGRAEEIVNVVDRRDR